MDHKSLVGQQSSPVPISKASTRNVEEAEESRQTSPSQSWSTMGSWRPGSKSSQASSGFSHGLSDSGFLDTPRPRSARDLEPTPEESATSARPLADSGFFEATPFRLATPLRAALHPAPSNSRLPLLKTVNETKGTFHGSVLLTITGTIIAALSVLPPAKKPHLCPRPTAFGSDKPLSSQQRTTTVHVLDALASICVAKDGEAHAVAIADSSESVTLYHAADIPRNILDERTESPRPEDQGGVLVHLGEVWEHLGHLHDRRMSPAAVADKQAELLQLLLSRTLPALRTRFHRHSDAVISGLDRVLHRSFSREEVLRHPQSWRFNKPISESEICLIHDTYSWLTSAKRHLDSLTSGAPEAAGLAALHRDLLELYRAWFEPGTRRNHEPSTYLLRHLEHLLRLPLAQFLRDIVWFSIASDRLCSAIHVPEVSMIFTKPLHVVPVPPQRQPFLANMDHDEVTGRASCLYLTDPMEIPIKQAFERDWNDLILARLDSQFTPGTHQMSMEADTHCECTLLAHVDQVRPSGLIRYIGLSHYSCLACWEHFASFNALWQNLSSRDLKDPPPSDGRYTYPWRPIHTRITNMRVESPWAAPSMRCDSNGLVSLYTQTTLLSDLMTTFDRARFRFVGPDDVANARVPPKVDLDNLCPVGEVRLALLSRA
ncbi:hypothetical protein AURDEDRAFT_178980 [Auricularia subglabra TFB-10046 SS5]|nr:hypothetical protein AURDEDRAFT_178980 [Auricularia subglabra TFB-10046 SS5]